MFPGKLAVEAGAERQRFQCIEAQKLQRAANIGDSAGGAEESGIHQFQGHGGQTQIFLDQLGDGVVIGILIAERGDEIQIDSRRAGQGIDAVHHLHQIRFA